MVQDVALNGWAVLVAAVVPLAVGAVWYTPLTFGNAWLRLVGRTAADFGARDRVVALAGSAIAAALASWVLATVLAFAETADAVEGMLGGFFCWLGFVLAAFLANDLNEKRPVRLLLVNAGYWLVSLVAMGAVLGAWR